MVALLLSVIAKTQLAKASEALELKLGTQVPQNKKKWHLKEYRETFTQVAEFLAQAFSRTNKMMRWQLLQKFESCHTSVSTASTCCDAAMHVCGAS